MSRRSIGTGWLLIALVSATSILGCGRDQAEDQVAETVGLRVGDLVIFDGYVTAPVVDHVTMAYLTIENIGTERVRLQSQVLDGPLGRRSTVDRITIEPGRTVALEPGGFQLTLEDLRVPLAPGDSVTIRLRFERAGMASVRLPVLAHLELVHILSPRAGDTAG
jgi:copper(I)-binding protein